MVVGWRNKPIRELAEIVSGGTPSTTISDYWNGNIIWVSPTDITGQKCKYLTTSERRITQLGLAKSTAVLLPKGAILLCSRATIGELAIASQPTATNQGFKNLICFENTDNEFLYYAVQPLKSKMLERASGSTFLEISKTALGDIEILIPPLPEQHAIAEVLSNMDGYIAALKKLIAKKRAVKQGAMQELLTGKRRLPGFDGEWVEKRIGDIGYCYSGLSGKSGKDFGTGKAKYITFLNVLTNTVIDTRILGNVQVNDTETQNNVVAGDMFFNTSSETPEEVGMCAVLLQELRNTFLNSFCFGFRLHENTMSPVFLAYYFNSNLGRKLMNVLAQGATRYNLSKAFFCDEHIKIPCYTEQTAIASVLSDMDAEIDALAAKLNKAKRIKQGMAQELLTGRIRLGREGKVQ
jgi:type I restriction enzyme S subunit